MKLRTTPTVPPADVVPSVDTLEPDLVPLATVAPELAGTPTIAELAKRLAADVVYDEVGRRCISVELAVVLLDDERQRREQAEARAEAKRAEHIAEVAARRQAREKRDQISDTDIARRVRSIEIDKLVEAGMSPAEAIARVDGPPTFDGDSRPPRPGSNPFTFNEGGGSIGPRPVKRSRRDRQAAQ